MPIARVFLRRATRGLRSERVLEQNAAHRYRTRRSCAELVVLWQDRHGEQAADVPLVIGGEEIEVGRERVGSIDPSRPGTVVANYLQAAEEDVDRVVECARQDVESWREKTIANRRDILFAVAEEIAGKRGKLMGAMLAEGGKTLAESDPEVIVEPQEPTDEDWKKKRTAAQRLCERCRKALKKVYDSEAFQAISRAIGKGKVGSHSIRKFASTIAKRFGILMPDIDSRGRWKGVDARNHRMVEGHYVSPDQPFVDANVARCLCLGNPVAYRLHPGETGVTDEWLIEHVVPYTYAFFGGDRCA